MKLVWSCILSVAVATASPAAAQAPAEATTYAAAVRAHYMPLTTMMARMSTLPERLKRPVSVNLTRVPLQRVLVEIATQARLGLSYGEDVAGANRLVTLAVNGVTAAEALDNAVRGTGWIAMVTTAGQVMVVKAPPKSTVAAPGFVVGRVTDAKTGEALVGADLSLDGTRWRTTSGDRGYYRIADVEPGNYTLVVRRVGYAKQNRVISVTSEQELTVDVALQPVATQLNELVTTVTGEQRRLEMGHVVSVINADSVVKEAPVTSLSELLNGRAPGLQVFTTSGQVGGQVQIQVRSPNSLSLSTEPLVIVDGVRYSSKPSSSTGPFVNEPTSRLNDLNPNDIATIEIVKGPSAATLYGTDAANGVVVVTTKRGRVGPARWNAYAKAAQTEIPTSRFPDIYWGWDPNSPGYSCPARYVTQGYCTVDSVTKQPNPLNDPDVSILGNKPRWEGGLNLSGGQPGFRYYFAGDVEQATGPLQMPKYLVEQLQQQRGTSELPADQLEPNAFNKYSLRSTVTSTVAQNSDITFQAGYTRNDTRTTNQFSPLQAASSNYSPANPYGTFATPAKSFSSMSKERLDRFFGSAAAQWRAWSWLQARATFGLDLGNSDRYSLSRPGEGLIFYNQGLVADERTRQLGITGDIGATAVARRGRVMFRTSIGSQYNRSLTDGLSGTGQNLPPGAETVTQALSQSTTQTYNETVTLGSYLEETVGINDRLFLTGAARMDGASTFGQDFDAVLYPKASVSWIVSDEPFMPKLPVFNEVRLRYAFGASGQQPTVVMALPTVQALKVLLNGTATNIYDVYGLGNPDLRPERVREHEFGLDASGMNDRLRMSLTWFARRTRDLLAQRPLPKGYGYIYSNLGLVTGHGFEAELTARVLESEAFSWQVTLQHSLHRSKVVDLGGQLDYRGSYGGYAEGYPLGARFGRVMTGYDDANGNGVIEDDEVQISTTDQYLGESTPPQSQTLGTMFGFLGQRVRLSSLIERRAGFSQYNLSAYNMCGYSLCRAVVDPTAPLAEQAQGVAVANGLEPLESGSLVRWRELALAMDAPASVARALRVRSATLALQVRNVALWSSFSVPDPESADVRGFEGATPKNLPQGRTWTLRLDLGL